MLPCVYGTFAGTEDDFENDRGCKDMLKAVKYKELYDNLGDEGRSTPMAAPTTESLRNDQRLFVLGGIHVARAGIAVKCDEQQPEHV